MVSRETVELILKLLQRGDLSHREIARRLGVGRTTVGLIAAQRRVVRGHRSAVEPVAERFVRCPECGGMVRPPCRLCYVRSLQRKRMVLAV